MDNTQESLLLIATTMVALVAFAIVVLAVMIIYRKRKIQHITEIKEINERFSRELLLAQLEVQHQTMQHIGLEIHDNVGQQLTLAFLYLQQLHTNSSDAAKRIQSISTIINDSLTDLRNLSRNLTGSDFMDKELDQLIRQESAKMQSTGLFQVNCQINEVTIEISFAVKNFIFRIFQEFLQNSLKHARCTTVEIQLRQMDNGLALTASDNGIGFNPELVTSSGIGLNNMKKRAAIMQANLQIISIPDKGTCMKLFVPSSQLNMNHASQYSNR